MTTCKPYVSYLQSVTSTGAPQCYRGRSYKFYIFIELFYDKVFCLYETEVSMAVKILLVY